MKCDNCYSHRHKYKRNTSTERRTQTRSWGGVSTYKSLCPLTWNVPCSRLSRLSCGERIHSGWCYFQSRTDSLPPQSPPCGSAESRRSQARVWKGGTRYPLRRSPRPRWLTCGNDPCVLKKKNGRKDTGKQLVERKEKNKKSVLVFFRVTQSIQENVTAVQQRSNSSLCSSGHKERITMLC